MRRFRCRPAKSASRCRAGSAWRWSRSARSSRASTPTYESVAAQVKKEIATERARAKVAELHNKMEDERGGGASVVEAAQKLGLDRRHHRRRRSLRPPARWPAGRPTFRAASTWSRRPSTAMSASTTTRSSSTAAMSGTTCSASRPSRERTLDEVQRPGRGEMARGPDLEPGCGRRRPRWCRSSSRAASSPTKPQRSGSKVETAAGFRRDASLPGVPASADHGGVPHRQGWRRTNARRRRQRMDRVPRHRRHRAAGRSRLGRGEETEGHAAARADRRTGRAIRHARSNPRSAPPSTRPPSRR